MTVALSRAAPPAVAQAPAAQASPALPSASAVPWRRWAIYQVGAWFLLSVVYTVQAIGVGTADAWNVFVHTLAGFVPCMLLTPAIAAVTLRFRFAEGHRAASALAHAMALPIFLFGGAALMGAFEWVVEGMLPGGALLERVQRAELRYFAVDTVLYVLVATATLALQYGRESRDRAVRAARLQTQLAEAQLHALGAQLQPHFLFNTLHVISALVRHDPRRAEQLIARMSELLRELLDGNDRAEIPLRDELAFLQKYVDIQEARFGSRLQVTFDVAPAVLDATVPRLVLQPLVENAVRHGLARRREPTTVAISARREAGVLMLEVCDDGAGLPGGAVPREGVGLSTTRARLQQLYGGAAIFSIEPALPRGTRCRVQIPGGASSGTAAIPVMPGGVRLA